MKSKLSNSPLPEAHSLFHVHPETWDNEEISIGFGDLMPREYAGYVAVITPDYLTYGDYDNSSMVERSNFSVFQEEFRNRYSETGRVAKEVHGGHGSTSIAIVAERPDVEGELWDDMMEWLSDLDTYPVKDEQLMSKMEMEAFDEAWKDWGESDFVRAIASALNKSHTFTLDGQDATVDADDVEEAVNERFDSVSNLWRLVNEHGNGEEYIIEAGGGVHINLDQTMRLLAKDTKHGWLDQIADDVQDLIETKDFQERQQKDIARLAKHIGLTPGQTAIAQKELVTSVSGLRRIQGQHPLINPRRR